jgi:hypothetical protein
MSKDCSFPPAAFTQAPGRWLVREPHGRGGRTLIDSTLRIRKQSKTGGAHRARSAVPR